MLVYKLSLMDSLKRGIFFALTQAKRAFTQSSSLQAFALFIQSALSFNYQSLAFKMQEPEGSSSGGGYYIYNCCWQQEHNCPGKVQLEGDACADCQVLVSLS